MQIIINLNYWMKIDTIFKKTFVHEDQQYSGKQRYLALRVESTVSKLIKPPFETNQDKNKEKTKASSIANDCLIAMNHDLVKTMLYNSICNVSKRM